MSTTNHFLAAWLAQDQAIAEPADDVAAGLRRWAEGSLPLQGAVYLLTTALGGRLLRGPWVRREADGAVWIDDERAASEGGYLSGGERRVLDVVASLCGDHPVVLGDVITGLDPDVLDAVLIALAHAGGKSI